ncbi:cytochrome P450 [Aspergillus brunneoviolaceus CBS 621.78]|uniref:Cytochrome P450 n=1 Tax=Aspergillus brunneoviolaceus CBS 621.78 TaxID=1450534 RepID=A0ACD1FTY7_9EURO|nr:cytochrome P450 [Aspergillus brunneoviolaceus CBS 621.78]RAH40460.1 cytochrome P450 [Aspergillus brunneoviolaceus CBS 621.78]
MVAALILGLYLAYATIVGYQRLSQFPGPVWARFTNLPRVRWLQTGRSHDIHMDLHDKYGTFVRLGPNMISISDPNALPTVYPSRPGVKKGNFYRALTPFVGKGDPLPLVFNTRDEAFHRVFRRPIAPLYTMANVLTYESTVDRVLDLLVAQLDTRFAEPRRIFDLGSWLQLFAFESMASVTFSKRYGFLEKGIDETGLLFTIGRLRITQIPWADFLWNKNPIVTRLMPTTAQPIMDVVMTRIHQCQQEVEKGGMEGQPKTSKDFLSQFNEARDRAVTAWTFSNVLVGSDTTAVAMRNLWYNLLSHPSSMASLQAEFGFQEGAGRMSRPHPPWSVITDLPYLDACLKEALRLHPPFCLPFERIVPATGMTVSGRYLPPGTTVGMNPWVINRNREVFGEDADMWRPERWLSDAHSHTIMEKTMFSFGAGRRMCLGKIVAIFEIKKLTATLLLKYHHPEHFKTENYFFFHQTGLMATIERRI